MSNLSICKHALRNPHNRWWLYFSWSIYLFILFLSIQNIKYMLKFYMCRFQEPPLVKEDVQYSKLRIKCTESCSWNLRLIVQIHHQILLKLWFKRTIGMTFDPLNSVLKLRWRVLYSRFNLYPKFKFDSPKVVVKNCVPPSFGPIFLRRIPPAPRTLNDF